ncbi:Nuclear pore complex protein Nup107 [Frankliniella fusca]|uniref:Nuclear pore complex protein n=1 Tax=Frankliniella fusca TaxID=407009 RepID=A0AAE1I366_9NEOP|nr:Nuclear pore complex protein Nup107 [Frankliniella fusca]
MSQPRDLESSLRLLDCALANSPSRGLPRIGHGSQRSIQSHNLSSMHSRTLSREDTLEASIIGMASGRLSVAPATRRPLPQNPPLIHDVSVTLAPHEFEFFGNQSVLSKTLSQGNWTDTWDRLHIQFLESFLTHGSEQQVFEIVGDFIQNCTDTLEVLQEECARKGIDQKDLVWLRNERNTWGLLYCLYQNRLSSRHRASLESPRDGHCSLMEDDDRIIASLKQHLSEKDVVNQLYENDPVVTECQLVIDWLEKCAADYKLEAGGPEIGHFTDKIVAWENTLLQLKMNQERDSTIAYGATKSIVSRLDPDAPIRENRSLHDLDWEDEARLMPQIFAEIRCGRLDAAQSLCCHCGQPWRAAVLEGWRLLHDPNYESAPSVGPVLFKMPIEGNPNRDLWKVCAWRMSEDYKMPVYTRATQGVLCGNLDALLPVCQRWEDVLWAHLRVLVDIRVEKEIRCSQLGYNREYAEMPEKYWQKDLTLEEIFEQLRKHQSCRDEAMKPDHQVQELLILEKIGPLLNRMEEWSMDCGPQMLRFFAHLVLVLRLLGHSDLAGDNVIQAYVKYLIGLREPRLVAHYVAQLPQEEQISNYASFLSTVTDDEERQACLAEAEEAGLDIETITTTVVEMIRKQESKNLITCETTASDLKKISALDWLVFYPAQRAEALWQANALIRSFLAAGKVDATTKAFNKIPSDSISKIVEEFQVKADEIDVSLHENLPRRVASSIREYFCYKAYLDAKDGFSDWHQHFHNAKPSKPTDPGENASFQERVAYDHRIAVYQRELDRWKQTMQSQTKTVRSLLYNVLLFPAGGWLVDSTSSSDQTELLSQEDDQDKLRKKELDFLRAQCIPEVVLLLHSVLFNMGEFAECVRLSDLVVSEQYELYRVYSTEQLGELMVKIADASLALLEHKKDPWGLPLSS